MNEAGPHYSRWFRFIQVSKVVNPREFLRIKKRVLRQLDERRFRTRRRADAPIGFLVDVEPYNAFDKRKAGAQRGNDLGDPLAFISASFGRRHLADDNWLLPRREQRINVSEYVLEVLPASVLRAPVVAVDPCPIDI